MLPQEIQPEGVPTMLAIRSPGGKVYGSFSELKCD